MASGLIFDDDGNDITMDELANPYAVPEAPRTEGGVWGSYVEYLQDLRTTALRLQAELLRSPGQLRWVFDGGRGAMLDENDQVVGYWNPPTRVQTQLATEEDAQLRERITRLRELSEETPVKMTPEEIMAAVAAMDDERRASFVPTTDGLKRMWINARVPPIPSFADARPGDPEWEQHAEDHRLAVEGFQQWLAQLRQDGQ